MNMKLQLFPHQARWDEISALVREILDYRITGTDGEQEPIVMFPWSAGGGYELGSVLGVVPGSSGTLLGSAVLNSQDWSHSKVSQRFTQSCTPEFGDALASANFIEIQRTKGDAFDQRRIVGIGITATIATTNPDAGKRGGQRACISVRRFDGMRRVVIRFRHSSEYEGSQDEKRKLQSQIIDLVALNLVAESLGLEHLLSFDEYEMTLEEGQWSGDESLESSRGTIVPAKVGVWDASNLFQELPYLAINADGTLGSLDELDPLTTTLIPCSANPFTPSHDEMAIHIRNSGRTPLFVINAKNAEKGGVTTEELLRRARGFVGRWPVVLLQDSGTFVEMAEQFFCDFAIGADTAARIFLPQYCETFGGQLNVYARLKASGIQFTVFPRPDARGRVQTSCVVPSMFRDLFFDAPDVISRFSSTAIRKASGS